MTEITETIDELKNEATQLGVEFHPNISAAKLKDRIDAKYKELEAEDPAEIVEVVEEKPVRKETAAQTRKGSLVSQMRKLANELFITTISDNDTRINSESDSCVANCSNAHFDLGTRIIPTNEKVEVRRGHLEALKAVKIPHHLPHPNDHTVRITVFRPRYSFQFHGKTPANW